MLVNKTCAAFLLMSGISISVEMVVPTPPPPLKMDHSGNQLNCPDEKIIGKSLFAILPHFNKDTFAHYSGQADMRSGEFIHPMASIRLNGKPWNIYPGDNLPNMEQNPMGYYDAQSQASKPRRFEHLSDDYSSKNPNHARLLHQGFDNQNALNNETKAIFVGRSKDRRHCEYVVKLEEKQNAWNNDIAISYMSFVFEPASRDGRSQTIRLLHQGLADNNTFGDLADPNEEFRQRFSHQRQHAEMNDLGRYTHNAWPKPSLMMHVHRGFESDQSQYNDFGPLMSNEQVTEYTGDNIEQPFNPNPREGQHRIMREGVGQKQD